MTDAICPTCNKVHLYPETSAGYLVDCSCGQRFTIEGPSGLDGPSIGEP